MNHTKQEPRIIIVGGGFGGLRAAQAMKSLPAQLTVVDRKNHHLFQPLLYQVAMAGLSPAEIAAPIRQVLRHQHNTKVLMADVEDIDLTERRLILSSQDLMYDYLVLAFGSAYHYFGNDAWARWAPSLKTINDATRIRREVLCAFEQAEMADDGMQRQRLLTFVVIGGGPTGVEVAGAIAELSRRVLRGDFRNIQPEQSSIILVEAGPRILPSFSPQLSNKAMLALEKLGVRTQVSAMVREVNGNGVLVNETFIPCATKIWAAGVRAEELSQKIPGEKDHLGRIKVDKFLQLPDYPQVFVIGDAALVNDQHGKPLPGVAPVAIAQGNYVAKYIRQHIAGNLPPVRFRYRDKGNLATVGRSFAVAQLGRMGFSGFPAWLLWTVIHVFYLIDFHNRVLVMIQWVWAYFSYHRGARLIVPKERDNQDR